MSIKSNSRNRNILILYLFLVNFYSFCQVQLFPFASQTEFNSWSPFSSLGPQSFSYNTAAQAVQYNVNTSNIDHLLSTQLVKTQLSTQLIDNFRVSFKVKKLLPNSDNTYFPLLLTQNIVTAPNQHPWRLGPNNTSTLGNQQSISLLGVVFTNNQIGFIYRQHQSSSAIIDYVNGFSFTPNSDTWVQIEKKCSTGYRLRVYTISSMDNTPIVDEFYNVPIISVPLGALYIANCNGNGELTRHNDILDDYRVEILQSSQITYDYQLISKTCTTPGQISVENISGGIPPYLISFNGINQGSNSIYSFNTEEEVLISVSDANGCNVSTFVNVSNANSAGIVNFPNVFTPDVDGINDVWFANGSCIRYFQCTIIDRWGNIISELNNINQSWDGKSEGKKCTSGVYFYSSTVEFDNNETLEYHGFIELIR